MSNFVKSAAKGSISKRVIAFSLSLVIAVSMISCFSATSVSAATNYGSTITATSSTKTLYPGDYLQNGDYKAILQSDGNFVVYKKSTGAAVWHLGTYYCGSYSNYRLAIQSDGNLVLYSNKNNSNYWLWASGTDTASYTCDNGYYFSLGLSTEGQLTLEQTYKGMSSTKITTWYSGSNRSRWHTESLYQQNYSGNLNGSSWSISGYGCALTSYTMVYNLYKGTSYAPTNLNYSPYVVGGSTQWKGLLSSDKIICNYNTSSEAATKIADALQHSPVIVCLESNSGNTHFVVVNRCTKDKNITTSDLLVNDPNKHAGSTTLTDAMNCHRNNYGSCFVDNFRKWSCSCNF